MNASQWLGHRLVFEKQVKILLFNLSGDIFSQELVKIQNKKTVIINTKYSWLPLEQIIRDQLSLSVIGGFLLMPM